MASQFAWKSLSVLLLYALLGATPIPAQKVSEAQVKAAFLYHFARFVEWPASSLGSADSPIVIGVLQDQSFAKILENMVNGKKINGRSIRVRLLPSDAGFEDCHMIFAPHTSGKRASAIVASLKGKSVLTVGDFDGFAQMGGIISFYVQDARVHFEINPDAANQAHLLVSAKLLALSRVVRGNGQ